VLASYRGFDTLGETMVIFTAGIAVILLLGAGSGRGGRKVADRAIPGQDGPGHDGSDHEASDKGAT
jgi:multicomponent Na+:H+ antiporter subunit B